MRSGQLLNDRYKIKAKIGGGGMADVYLARDIILDRDVAVKALRMEYADDQEFIARFDREAQSATSLSHPNVVSIYDVGEEDHLLYMIMEYVDGMTLKEYIQKNGPLDVQEALDIMNQISSAIAHAHANNIVHRDIKPQNILINHFGQAKVTDFGIAIALSATALTQTNSILGSVHYLSPEQARGGMATKKSDIYSLGIVLFEMLTGRLPFSGQSPVSIALKHLQNDTPSVRRFNQDIPQSVENIVLKATAKDPFHRYDSIYDLLDAVETALSPEKINEEPFSPPKEVGDETKAIPIITDNFMEENYNQETIIHHSDGITKQFEENQEQPDLKPTKKNKLVNGKKSNKEQNKPKKPKKRWKKVLLILSIIFVLVISSAIALFVYPGWLQPKDVTIPDVVGMEEDEAREILEELNLHVEEEYKTSDEFDEGLVIKTSPSKDRTIKEESTVTMTISEGKEKFKFGDYEGRDYSQIKRILENEGFTQFSPYEVYSDRPQGEIISQISPNPDSEVIPSETEVVFEVSKGPEQFSLKDLSGLKIEDAETYLKDNGLKMNLHENYSDNVPEGSVIRHSPEAGEDVEKGDTVDVYESIGKEELPPKSHSITLTVPYEVAQEDKQENPDNGEDSETVEENDQTEQTVRIYIGDMNNDISEVYREEQILEDTSFTFTLTIPYDGSAEYRITRDDEEIASDEIFYEDER